MKKNSWIPVLALLTISLAPGCGADQANRNPAALQASMAGPRQDNVSPQDLKSGLDSMQGRVLRSIGAYNEIAPSASFRYFMHPAMDKDAVMEFDVSTLSSLTLSPRISVLQGGCLADPQAGKVDVTYALDENRPVRFSVDRNYEELLEIVLDGSRKMTVAVNQGNGAITCDWFELGFLNVRPG